MNYPCWHPPSTRQNFKKTKQLTALIGLMRSIRTKPPLCKMCHRPILHNHRIHDVENFFFLTVGLILLSNMGKMPIDLKGSITYNKSLVRGVDVKYRNGHYFFLELTRCLNLSLIEINGSSVTKFNSGPKVYYFIMYLLFVQHQHCT